MLPIGITYRSEVEAVVKKSGKLTPNGSGIGVEQLSKRSKKRTKTPKHSNAEAVRASVMEATSKNPSLNPNTLAKAVAAAKRVDQNAIDAITTATSAYSHFSSINPNSFSKALGSVMRTNPSVVDAIATTTKAISDISSVNIAAYTKAFDTVRYLNPSAIDEISKATKALSDISSIDPNTLLQAYSSAASVSPNAIEEISKATKAISDDLSFSSKAISHLGNVTGNIGLDTLAALTTATKAISDISSVNPNSFSEMADANMSVSSGSARALAKALRTHTSELENMRTYHAASAPSSRSRISRKRPESKVSYPSDLGELVRSARESMDLSQQEFADLAGVGRRFISELENGKKTLELGKVLEVCSSAGIDLYARRR